jgi:pyrimidine-nucleoside phosphorylase
MLESGKTRQWKPGRPKVDKHSTGGIGDKISVPLAPILAVCGLDVPMISGRALGTTGGTIDKLESIPGFRTDLSLPEITRVVETVGCVITAATGEIAPADKRLYALRDVTGTVPSIPLITASILSKKMAEGLDALVLDVKWGNGAFMKTADEAEALAESLVRTATELGVPTRAVLTDMNRPLGKMIGNAVEIDESVDTLLGRGPADVVQLTERFAAELLLMCGKASSLEAGQQLARKSIDDGSAYRKLVEMVAAQGGDLEAPRPRAPVAAVTASRSGWITSIDSDRVGLAIIQMGGGRKVVGATIDHSVGLEMLVDIGSQVRAGEDLVHLFVHPEQLEEARQLVAGSITIGDEPTSMPPLFGKTIQ